MFLFRKTLFFFVFIYFFTPLTVFGMCTYAFSELYTELALPKRIVKLFYNANIHTIEELTEKTPEELLRLKQFGEDSLKEVQEALEKIGLALSEVEPSSDVAVLDISTRNKNALIRRGIHTIEELTEKTPEELLQINQFGRTSLKEVQEALEKIGLALSEVEPSSDVAVLDISTRNKNALIRRGIHTIEELTKKTPEELLRLKQFGEDSLKEVQEALEKIGLTLSEVEPSSDVAVLDISTHTKNALIRRGIHTIEELTEQTPEELLQINQFRKDSLKEVQEALEKIGLSLSEIEPSSNVAVLDISTHNKNALIHRGIHTIEELTEQNSRDLLKMGLGNISLYKIKETLFQFGLTLSNSSPIESFSDVAVLDISTHTKTTLIRRGIHTIEELTEKTPEELLQINQFGRTSLKEVQEALEKRDLALSDPLPI